MHALQTHDMSVLRVALFFCCVGYCALAFWFFKPSGHEILAAIVAVWTQFSMGVFLDVQIVRAGFWKYHAMPATLSGVPLDLHWDWTLLWGFALVWLASRLRVRGTRATCTYLCVWTLATVTFDAAFGRHLPFMEIASPLWWLADAVLVGLLLVVTLWIYNSILFPPQSRARHRWNCRARSVLYVSSLLYAFYVYLPSVILARTGAARALLGLSDWRILVLAALPALALGGWAMLAFADQGGGTPLPLDPPLRLVTSGPYKFVRNPMQIAGMWLAILLALCHPTKFIAAYVFDMAITATVTMNLFEHAQLRRSFGAAFEHYAGEFCNWIPRFSASQTDIHKASSDTR